MKNFSVNFERSVQILLFFVFSLVVLFPLQSEEYRFVVWGDSQFENPEVFEEVVLKTELLQPDFVLQIGDLIRGYTYDADATRTQWERYFEQVAPLSAPIYPAAGNHDVTTAEIAPVFKEVWGLEDYHYSFKKFNSLFIALNTCENQDFNTISSRQEKWLLEELEKNKDVAHVFLYFHHPLHFKEDHEASEQFFNWNALHEKLLQYPVKGVFTGHSHVYDYQVRDGIHYFCLNTSGRLSYYNHLGGFSHHFLFITVRGKEVTFSVIEKNDIYKPDAVAPYEWLYSRAFLRDEQTILIPNPEENPGEYTATLHLINEAPLARDFTLTWKTGDYRWDFSPWGKNVHLPAEETKTLTFNISIPHDSFQRHELPYLQVTSPYTTTSGLKNLSSYNYRLFSPPKTQAVRIKETIQLDGKLDEPVWKTAPVIDSFYTDKIGSPAEDKTIVRVLYNDDYLYVGVWGEEPEPQGLAAHAYGEIPLVFADDDFELYFDTNRDLETFYRLMVNPAGTVLSSNPMGYFTFDFEVAAYTGEDFWSAEFKIPFSELETASPEKGEEWGFNVRRHRQQAVPAQSDWVKMRNHPYQPPYFGLLQFQ